MLTYTVHNVRVIQETQELPPQDGWRCFEPTGMCRLQCSCGHSESPIPTPLGRLMAQLRIHRHA